MLHEKLWNWVLLLNGDHETITNMWHEGPNIRRQENLDRRAQGHRERRKEAFKELVCLVGFPRECPIYKACMWWVGSKEDAISDSSVWPS